MDAAGTTAKWRAAYERGDLDAARSCLADAVEVISPLTAEFRVRGKRQATDLLAAAFELISDVRFDTEIGTGDARARFFYARAGSQRLEEAQPLRFDDAGQVREVTLFGRPLPALTAVMADIGPRLLRRQQRPGLARVVGLATVPLAAMTRLGEKRLVPLADPGRAASRRAADREDR